MPEPPMPTHHGPESSERPGHENETIRLLLHRASCRSFAGRPIPPETLDSILEAGIHSATGGNLQPTSIIRIEDEERRARIAKLGGQPFIASAPVLLLFCMDWRRLQRWARLEAAPFTATKSFPHFWISFQDTVICAQTITIAADAVGLGSVYIGTTLEFIPELRETFALPSGVFPVVLVCLGYPRGTLQPRKKLGVETIVHRERYRELEDRELLEAFEEKYAGQRIEITEDRLQALHDTAKSAHGDSFAEECRQRAVDNGRISPVQRYFGLHYRADQMASHNESFLRLMEESGFSWLAPDPFAGSGSS